jgi:hypothetical protein
MPLPAEWAWIKTLIDEEGRAFTITVPGATSDPTKPWRGNVAGTPTGVKGVFFFYKASELDGDHVKRGDQRIILYPSDTINIESGLKIVDSLDNSSWTVIAVQKISNKSDVLAFILQVRQ